jgi:hypothetical protein
VLESGNMFVFRTMILGPVASSKRGVSHEIGSPTHLWIFSAIGADRDYSPDRLRRGKRNEHRSRATTTERGAFLGAERFLSEGL